MQLFFAFVFLQREKFDLSRYIVNGQWEISGTTFEQKLETTSENSFYTITFTLELRRRVLYYTIYLVLPGALIALLAGIIFVLPQDCSERITVGKNENLMFHTNIE